MAIIVLPIVSNIILEIEQYVEKVLGDNHAGFRRNRSTSNHIFSLSMMFVHEKCYEYHLFNCLQFY